MIGTDLFSSLICYDGLALICGTDREFPTCPLIPTKFLNRNWFRRSVNTSSLFWDCGLFFTDPLWNHLALSLLQWRHFKMCTLFRNWICQWWEFCIIVCLSDISVLGYGNVTPQTFAGRLFCILYGLIGIPFTLLAIADVGKFVSEIVERWQKAFANFTGFVHISMSC